MNQAVPPGGFASLDDALAANARAPVPDPGRRAPGPGEGRAAPRPRPDAAPAARQPVLSAADVPLLREVLFEGERSVARRTDLTELHARLVRQLALLGEGLAASQARHAEEERAAAHGRLEAMEASVNRMEGALRIEFEPVLRRALDEVLRERDRPLARPLRRVAGGLAFLLAGIAVGAAVSDEIGAAAAAARQALAAPGAEASPNGGSGSPADPAF